jgi:ketosteroid isomerase-like protein
MLKKTLTLIATVALLGAACSSSDENADAVKAAEATQSAMVDAFLSSDVEAAVAQYAEDVEFHDPTFGRNLTGVAAMRSQGNTVFRWTDIEQTRLVERFVSEDGTRGLVVYHWVGESDMGPFDLLLVQVHEYDDGVVQTITNYYGDRDPGDLGA